MRFTVHDRLEGGYVIVPAGHPPLPVVFDTHAEAREVADALTASSMPPAPAHPPPPPPNNEAAPPTDGLGH